jgi:hypothetical protein
MKKYQFSCAAQTQQPIELRNPSRTHNGYNIGCCEFSCVDRLHKNRHNNRSNVSNRHSRISGKNPAP